jgi:hypothetical protein
VGGLLKKMNIERPTLNIEYGFWQLIAGRSMLESGYRILDKKGTEDQNFSCALSLASYAIHLQPSTACLKLLAVIIDSPYI